MNAIILVDYLSKIDENHFATNVEKQRKTLETRMRMFKYQGDIVICCGAKSKTSNSGKALCVVRFGEGRAMTDDDERNAMIENQPGRIVYPLSNFRYFNKKFKFSNRRESGSFHGIF